MTKVAIGSQYRPHQFERRSLTEYAALRPTLSRDALLLQDALINERRDSRAHAALTVLCAVGLAVVIPLIAAGVL